MIIRGFGTVHVSSMWDWAAYDRQIAGLKRHWVVRWSWYLTRHWEAVGGAPVIT